MTTPDISRARRALAVAARLIALHGVRSVLAARALHRAHHAVAGALDAGHRVADIHHITEWRA
ncbi:hypothetical protein ACFC1B_07115 [Streptomyces xiamenensis]|uniref:hypothetical protein n=1 Tax=Streptomyces xiamenensis TaxID=408015 RepID=UPI0035E1A1B8